MARREDRHWWYAGMRRVALGVLDRALAGREGLLVLDAGCGTGGTTVRLGRYGGVVGLDLAWEALRPAAGRGLAELRRVLKPPGVLLLRVPAHDWLRGAHDRLVHTRHRYAPDEVRAKLE